ncbi:MAG: peptide deformylase [Endomicrobiia bacterium]|nr:peptide deformylase [Endomicrobiaceae bacterium]MDD3052968.1 peptide deformylase [Endomicrobiaceae bacterium]MDD3921981.1 peptide deformylase [Endomicrobiaceae bacterium]MDD5101753.1 peptide deformylase [Endomicrobiaceae bacterium]
MAILEILTIPNNILKQVSTPIEIISGSVKKLVSDMKETMKSSSHCVGIAAPQVGVSSRIIVVDISLNMKPHKNNGLLIMINPRIIYSSGKLKSREGCLSVPNFTGNVIRKAKIEVEYLDIDGTKKILKTSGFESIVLQHEIDHLDGFLFLDRVSSLKTDIFKRI